VCELWNVLQNKVKESLQKAASQANEMLLHGSDVIAVLHTLDAAIQYGNENKAYLTAEAKESKSQLHLLRSSCMIHLVCSGCSHYVR